MVAVNPIAVPWHQPQGPKVYQSNMYSLRPWGVATNDFLPVQPSIDTRYYSITADRTDVYGSLIGGTPGNLAKAWDGPYVTYRADMLGNVTNRRSGRDYPYDMDRHPDLAAQFNSGQIDASGYFRGAMTQNVLNDRDELANVYNPALHTPPPRISMRFNQSGGGRYSWSGGGFSF